VVHASGGPKVSAYIAVSIWKNKCYRPKMPTRHVVSRVFEVPEEFEVAIVLISPVEELQANMLISALLTSFK
jgi:hypothetical protein